MVSLLSHPLLQISFEKQGENEPEIADGELEIVVADASGDNAEAEVVVAVKVAAEPNLFAIVEALTIGVE